MGFPRWNRSGRGCKGGEGATRGRTAAIYEATLPDGRVTRKASFKIEAQAAWMAVSHHDGEWHVSAVVAEAQEHNGSLRPIFPGWSAAERKDIAIPARRIK